MPDHCRVTPEGFVWLLGAACQLHRLPFDAASLLKKFPLPHSMAVLHKALETFGFCSAVAAIDAGALQRLAFPCFALVPARANRSSPGLILSPVASVSPAKATAEAPADFVLLLKAEGDCVVYLTPDDSKPRKAATNSFLAGCLGWVLQIGRADKTAANFANPAEHPSGRPGDGPTAPKPHGRIRFPYRQPLSGKDETSVLSGDFHTQEPSLSTATSAATQPAPCSKPHWFRNEIRKHHAIWRTVLLLSLIIQAIGLATPLFAQMIIDKVVVQQSGSTLVVLGLALTFFIVFTGVVNWLRHYLVLQTGHRIATALGHRVVNRLLRLPLSYFETNPVGVLLSRLQGIETVQRVTANAAFMVIFDLPFLLLFIGAMFWLSWKLALLSILAIGLITLLAVSVMPLFRDQLNRQFLLGARNQAYLAEYLASMSTVKMLQMEPYIEKRYSDHLASHLAVGLSSRQASSSHVIATQALEQTMMLIVLIAGATLLMENAGFTIGMLVAFQMLASRIGEPLLRLVGLWRDIQQVDVAVDRLGEILDQPTEKQGVSSPRGLSTPGRLDVVDLAFRYSPEQAWLFRHLDLVLPAGCITAIIGPSGCGKTTLGKLLQGLYDPQHGQIFLDGDHTQEFAANELRNHFGVVPQETTLFAGTIYDNIVATHSQASFDEVLRACKAAGIHEAIDQLPDGYRTELGDRGAGLSGGQRQRLAFARALLRQPRILIIDEGLSSLDKDAIEKISMTINNLKGNMTVIYLGHHLPPALQVDQLIDLGRSLEKHFKDTSSAACPGRQANSDD